MSPAPNVTREGVSGASAQVEWAPVFVDASGHRRRWLRLAGYVVAVGCLLFAIALVTSLLWSPITPGKSRAAPTKHHTATSQAVSFAHADNHGSR
jgi:hypothetical protein